jgi:hypothetical protein
MFCYGPFYVQWQQVANLVQNFWPKLSFFDDVASFAYQIRLPPSFFMLESVLSEIFLIGDVFVMDQFM